MIGKIFRRFSNDWKKLSAQGGRKGSARGKRIGGKWEGRGRGTGGGKLQEWLEGRCADLNGLEGGGSYIERIENRCVDRNGGWDARWLIFVGPNSKHAVARRRKADALLAVPAPDDGGEPGESRSDDPPSFFERSGGFASEAFAWPTA
jgi:hypothetical protein